MSSRATPIGRGAWRIRLPLPWKRLPEVNAFVFRQSDGWMLLDCGLNTDETFAAFDEAFTEIGLGWRSIARIVVTHLHPDHVGGAARARRLSGAPILMQPDEARLVSPRSTPESYFDRTDAYLRRHGAPPDMVEAIREQSARLAGGIERFTADGPVDEGMTFDYEGGRLETIRAPGHSPVLLCFVDPANRRLFSTDAILEKITPNIGIYPFSSPNPLGEYFDSLARLEAIEADSVVPSHGDPFAGHPEWIARTRLHHRRRCDQLARVVEAGPLSGYQATVAAWGPNRPAGELRLALAEALAHLEFLARTGRAERRELDGEVRWQAI
jgi:glyoxylase-like metal-dependent hydrolase (beta-lactamase superfamily II)